MVGLYKEVTSVWETFQQLFLLMIPQSVSSVVLCLDMKEIFEIEKNIGVCMTS